MIFANALGWCFAGNLELSGDANLNGTPVVHMWDCGKPDPGKPASGYPVLSNAVHVCLYQATLESGAYSHHSKLIEYKGALYAMWSNGINGEDAPGQFVRYAISRDGGKSWTKPQELFPRVGPIGPFHSVGVYATAAGWDVYEGRLYGCMSIRKCTGFANADESEIKEKWDRNHIYGKSIRVGYVGREVVASDEGVEFGDIFHLPKFRKNIDLADLGNAIIEMDDTYKKLSQVLYDRRLNAHPMCPKGIDTPRLCEPVFYDLPDGRQVSLVRDDLHNHRMYVSIREKGDPWPKALPTDIPDSPSLSHALNLPGDVVLLIGNQMAPEFDNGNKRKHYGRDPLMVSISRDGFIFERAYALRVGQQKFRVTKNSEDKRIGGRGGGGQYPYAIVVGTRLCVLYSMGKEDIWFSSVELSELVADRVIATTKNR